MDNTTLLVAAALGYYVYVYKPEWIEQAKSMVPGKKKGCGCGCSGDKQKEY